MTFFFATPASWHELYPGCPLRIQDLNSDSGPLLHVDYKYLRNDDTPAHYYDCAIAAINAWDGFANVTDGGCNQFVPANMNISFRCSESIWSDLGLSSSTLGFTWIVDSEGDNLLTATDFENSSGIIRLAIIYMNPSGTIFYSGAFNTTMVTNRIQKTMVHEIGHAMGLGPPDVHLIIQSPLPLIQL